MTVIAELERIAVFDLETTGVDTESARIVTAYIALMNGDGSIHHEWNWLVNPGVEIPEAAEAVHGISTEHAREHGQDAGDAVAEIRDVIFRAVAAHRPITAYNARYDLTLLERESRRHGSGGFTAADIESVIDPFVLDRMLDKYRKGKRTLAAVTALYGVTLDGAHDASVDALATGHLAWAMLKRFPAGMTIEALHSTQTTAAAEQASSLQAYLRKTDPLAVVQGQWPLADFTSEIR